MALELKFKDEHGILQINMSPTDSPTEPKERPELTDPKFDTINNRFGQYDLFGGKYDLEGQSLFRSRYNSVEEELANTPYAFTTERSLKFNNLDVTIQARGMDISPSKDLEDDRFFNRSVDDDLFGPQIETETPAFTVTQLIHAQDRYYDLSSRGSVVGSPAKDGSRKAPSRQELSFEGSVAESTVKTGTLKTPIKQESSYNSRSSAVNSPAKDARSPRTAKAPLTFDLTSGSSVTNSPVKSGKIPRAAKAPLKQEISFDLSSRSSTTNSPVKPATRATMTPLREELSFELSSRSSTSNSPIKQPRSSRSPLRQELSFDLSSRSSATNSPVKHTGAPRAMPKAPLMEESSEDGAFEVLETRMAAKAIQIMPPTTLPVVPTAKRKRETSFAILAETPVSRPTSPRSLPVDIRADRRSPFKGRGFREETSRHNTPRTSAANSLANSRANSRANSPPRRRTHSLSKIDKMATATLPMTLPTLSRPHSPRNFVKENMEEVRELSELNRERHEAEAERKRMEEEETLLREMGLLDKNAKSDAIRSVVCSRATSRAASRSSSPNKLNLRSRSNSPSAILHYTNEPTDSREFNTEDGMSKPTTHRSSRTASKSVPQSNEGSPKHSKIPKRQNSVSPARSSRRDGSTSRRNENGLRNQKYMSNSTSSINDSVRIGNQPHDKRGSKSTQHLSIAPAHIKGKPPISPGRGGPPPANRTINSKRLSPIVGTPSKSPIDDQKPGSAKTTKPTPATRKPVKTAGNTPATSRLNSRQPSRTVSRDPSPDKRRTAAKTSTSSKPAYVNGRPVVLGNNANIKTPQKPAAGTSSTSKPEPKKPISRTNSIKSLIRTPSNKTLIEKPPLAKKNSKKDLTDKQSIKSASRSSDLGSTKGSAKSQRDKDNQSEKSKESKKEIKNSVDSGTDAEDHVLTQDNETQYDKITNDKGELVLLTKKNIVSMTTAAITSQPLEIVTTVTNQLPAAFEKAREKGIFERLSSRDSLAPKDDEIIKESEMNKSKASSSKPQSRENSKLQMKEKDDKKSAVKVEEKKPPIKPLVDDSIRGKLLQPPYNNPQVDRVRQKIDEILKVTPEVSTENILTPATKVKEPKMKSIVEKAKADVREAKEKAKEKAKEEARAKTEKTVKETKDETVKQSEVMAADIRSEATKIVDSIITPVEEPKEIKEPIKTEVKKEIEPIVMVVNERKHEAEEIVEKMTETLVKGEPEVEVQSSNLSSPGKMTAGKMGDGNESDKSAHSNGGFPQSTSTTPRPPARTRKQSKDEKTPPPEATPPPEEPEKKPNICTRILGKCKSKCCPCCIKGEDDDETQTADEAQKKGLGMSKLNCFKKTAEDQVSEAERSAGKVASIEFENETKRKRTLRDICCCGRTRRISDASGVLSRDAAMSHDANMSHVVTETSCWGKRAAVERRDSILSDRPPPNICTRMCTWMRGACRRHSEQSSLSRRTSLFSKNKSLSPTLPPEDTRTKLDTSLVEHTSVMKGSIPVLPLVLAALCCLCNVVFPGLGTILSGMFCLCFGIPRFGVYDGAKHRIGSFIINLVVGCGQFFTVLFCLVGWGWSIWWGVIMVRVAIKYRKLKAEEAAQEAEAPPVTANNHTRA